MIRKILGYTQSHYTEVAQGAIFLEQNMRSGLKKNWADEQLLKTFFLCFQGQKINLKFFQKYCSVRTKKLHKISFIYIFLNFYFGKINCVLLYYIGDTSTRNHRYKYHKRDFYETFIHIELKEYLAIIQLLKKMLHQK